MIDDHQIGARSAPPTDEVAGLCRELAEALTALGNYGAAAARISGHDPDIRKASEAFFGQHERAAKTLGRLRSLLRC